MRLRRTAVAASIIALAGAACARGTGAPVAGATSTPAVNAARATLLPTDVATLPDFDFGRFEALLRQLRGTPVVVNIWASWCGPCRQEARHLAAAADRFGSRIQFLGVDIQDSRASAAAFIDEFHWPYPSVFDTSGDIRDRLGLLGQPATLFYDRAGRLVATWQGPITPSVLGQRIDQILL
jgi:thiol-disulfide isomerase/thioredoxin